MILWKNALYTSMALSVNVKKETEKAIQFEVTDNPKYTFWLPKKALSYEDAGNDVTIATVAKWCNMDKWFMNAAERYGSYYKR